MNHFHFFFKNVQYEFNTNLEGFDSIKKNLDSEQIKYDIIGNKIFIQTKRKVYTMFCGKNVKKKNKIFSTKNNIDEKVNNTEKNSFSISDFEIYSIETNNKIKEIYFYKYQVLFSYFFNRTFNIRNFSYYLGL
jgi:hypothetical protein